MLSSVSRDKRVKEAAEKLIQEEDKLNEWNQKTIKKISKLINELGFDPVVFYKKKRIEIYIREHQKKHIYKAWFFLINKYTVSVRRTKDKRIPDRDYSGLADAIYVGFITGHDNIDEFLDFMKFAYESRDQYIHRMTGPY